MPVEVVGLNEAIKAMRALQPTLEKELKTEMKQLLNPVVKKARGYVPSEIAGLSHWTFDTKANKINAHTSVFRAGKFPKFNPSQVRSGIKSELFPSRRTSNGFISLVRIVNATAAGAIYETAGRKNPHGQPWNRKSGSHDYSHSLNPKAGEHFIRSLGGHMVGVGKSRGRLIYRAWSEDQGRTLGYVMQALNKTLAKTKKFIDASQAFRSAA